MKSSALTSKEQLIPLLWVRLFAFTWSVASITSDIHTHFLTTCLSIRLCFSCAREKTTQQHNNRMGIFWGMLQFQNQYIDIEIRWNGLGTQIHSYQRSLNDVNWRSGSLFIHSFIHLWLINRTIETKQILCFTFTNVNFCVNETFCFLLLFLLLLLFVFNF